MREASVIQAGEPAIVQGIRGVCVVGDDGDVFGVSVALTGLTCCHKTRPAVTRSQHTRSSLRRECLGTSV